MVPCRNTGNRRACEERCRERENVSFHQMRPWKAMNRQEAAGCRPVVYISETTTPGGPSYRFRGSVFFHVFRGLTIRSVSCYFLQHRVLRFCHWRVLQCVSSNKYRLV